MPDGRSLEMRSGTAGIEGQLWIELERVAGRVQGVRIRSSRPVHAARVLQGRAVGEALTLLPRLFTLCGTAQACAGVRACEQALGVRAPVPLEWVRDLLVGQETLREHLRQVLFDWPPLLDAPPEIVTLVPLRALQMSLRRALMAGRDPFQCADAEPWRSGLPPRAWSPLRDVDALVDRAVYGIPPLRWLEIEDLAGLAAWAAKGRTLVARLVDQLLRQGWSELGRCPVEALPELEQGLLHGLLQDEAAVEQPLWQGECRETGCLGRTGSPLLVRLQGQFGNGLLVRWVARLTEMAQLAAGLWSVERISGRCAEGEQSSVLGQQSPVLRFGIGQAMAARGLLVHRVQLERDRIVRYQVLAPTEWNFHPAGVVAQALAGLEGEPALIERQARLLINAIDPCVGYTLTINEGP